MTYIATIKLGTIFDHQWKNQSSPFGVIADVDFHLDRTTNLYTSNSLYPDQLIRMNARSDVQVSAMAIPPAGLN